MPKIAIDTGSLGISVANFNTLLLAINEVHSVYQIASVGGEHTVFLGEAKTTERDGSMIPMFDEDGRKFPTDLTNKTVIFKIGAGARFGGVHPVSIEIKSIRDSQETLYSLTDHRIPLFTTHVAGFEVDGTAERITPRETELARYYVMMRRVDELSRREIRAEWMIN